MFNLFSVPLDDGISIIKADCPIPYTHRDIVTVLDRYTTGAWTVYPTTVCRVVSATAITLGKRNADDFKFVLDYAIKRNIAIGPSVEFVDLLDSSLVKYFEYFNGNHLTAEAKMNYRHTMMTVAVACHDSKFTPVLNILFKLNFQDTTGPIGSIFKKDLRHVLMVATRSVDYSHFIKLLTIQRMPHLFVSLDILAAYFIQGSTFNPDGRVFDYFFDKYAINIDSNAIYLGALGLSGKLNTRSAFKFLKAEMKQSKKGYFNRHELAQNGNLMREFALLGAFKDPMFVRGLHPKDVPVMLETRNFLKTIDNQSDKVIACLKSKFPNVLADLVLQYLM